MHDRNGSPLKEGDTVLIEAKITTCHASEDYCNVSLAIGSEKEHGPDNVHASVVLNARQTLLLKRGE